MDNTKNFDIQEADFKIASKSQAISIIKKSVYDINHFTWEDVRFIMSNVNSFINIFLKPENSDVECYLPCIWAKKTVYIEITGPTRILMSIDLLKKTVIINSEYCLFEGEYMTIRKFKTLKQWLNLKKVLKEESKLKIYY